MATKDTNPKDALGIRKVPMHTVPCGPMLEVGLAMLEGGCKYGTHNYREAGCRHSVYYDSTVRHMMDWFEGQDIDPDSGVHHVIKAIAGLVVLRDSMLMGNDVDDRPLQYPGGLKMAEFNKTASDILDKYPERVEPFTQVRRDYERMDAARPTMDELVSEKLARVGQTMTAMPELEPITLPDDNKVPTDSFEESDEENSCRDVNDPKRRMFCTVGGCFNKGLPNQVEPYIYRCPKHPIKKGE